LQSKEWMERSDAAAVAETLAGDRDAFRVLVEHYSWSVFRLAYRMTGNEHDAEDVVQETFLRAYRRLDQFELRANFGTWVYRIATNYALDLIRLRRRRGEESSSTDAEYPGTADVLPASDPNPERLMFSSEVRQKVAAGFAQLSAVERAAFVLRHFEGQSIEEIGGALGLQTSATKQSIFRAVRKMRKALEPVMSSAR
jgi:RNA polymerase sigma-70 factor (ECF subfamily)